MRSRLRKTIEPEHIEHVSAKGMSALVIYALCVAISFYWVIPNCLPRLANLTCEWR